jgi:hypothetical protein
MPFEDEPNVLKFYLYRKDRIPIGNFENFEVESWPPANLNTAHHNIVEVGYDSTLGTTNALYNLINVSETLSNGFQRVLYLEYIYYLSDEILLSGFRQRLLTTVNSMLKYAHSDYTFSDMKPDILTEPIGALAGGKRKKRVNSKRKRVSSKRKTNKRRSSHRK